jgi:Tetratricopeptide repeat
MRKFIASVALVTASALAWALPSLAEVEAQVQQGHYAQAESMMREVVAAKPDSPRAHYVYAEVLAHDGKFAAAADEARLARQLDPDIKFTSAEKFSAFEALLQRQQGEATRARAAPSTSPAFSPGAPAAVVPAAASAGVPSWVWLAGLALVAFLLWRGFSRSRAAAAGAGAMAAPGAFGGTPLGPNAGAAGMPYGAGYPAARPGSGMLGIGAAAVGGVAAGMLADELLHRRPDGRALDSGSAGQAGFFDSPDGGGAASDLENRSIDFGSGGSDWDSGSADVGGGSDGGGWD